MLKKLLGRLPRLPFPIFVVGGAVRDVLLGLEPKDVDLATPLPSEEVIRAAEAAGFRVFPKGAAFGVVSLLVGGREYEVASFRAEWYGEDACRPEGVRLGVSLEEDLARRDFTVNAMAVTVDGEVVDPFGGREDLARGVIRAVGDPVERFREDALRSFRACRFAAGYGFKIAPATLAAMWEARGRMAGVSVERVRDELEKILLAPRPSVGLRYLAEGGLLSAACRARENGKAFRVPVLPELERLVGLPQNPRYHRCDVWEHTLAVVDGVPAGPALRWAALLHDVGKGLPGVRRVNRRGEIADWGHDRAGAQMAREILSRLRVCPDVARRAAWLVGEHMSLPASADERVVLRWLVRLSRAFGSKEELRDGVGPLLALRRADLLAGRESSDLAGLEALSGAAARVVDALPFYRADLAVDGRDVVAAGFSGPQVGRELDVLLERVRQDELPNDRDALLAALRKRAERFLAGRRV